MKLAVPEVEAARERIPLREVRLEGWRLHLHRALMIILLSLATTALVTYFMDWHEIRETSSDFGLALGCAFTVDCDPSTFVDDGPNYTGAVTRDSGWDHSGAKVPFVLLLIIAVAAAVLARPSFAASLAASIGILLLFVALIIVSFDLEHLFEHTVSLWAEAAHGVSAVGLFFVAAASIVAQPILYTTARRELVALRSLERQTPGD
jgi:hypothetical protein